MSPVKGATWGPIPHLPKGEELESTRAQGYAGPQARPNFLCFHYTDPSLPNPPALPATCFPAPGSSLPPSSPFPPILGRGSEGWPQPEKEASRTLGILLWMGGVSVQLTMKAGSPVEAGA